MSKVNEDLENEKPSTIKKDFQRWLIAAGIVLSLLFLYIFIYSSHSFDDDNKAEKGKGDVPKQTQDGVLESESAISKFKADVKRSQYVKDETDGLNSKIAPSYSVPNGFNGKPTLNQQRYTEQQIENRDAVIKKLLAEREMNNSYKEDRKSRNKEDDPFVALREKEKIRAFESLRSRDTLGSSNAFYNKNEGENKENFEESNDQKTTNNFIESIKDEPLKVRQAKVKQQIARTNQVLEMIRKGELDPSNIPPEMLQMMRGQ